MENLICINPKNYKLTEGKEYEILKVEQGNVFLINDSGKTVRYSQDLFEEIAQEVAIPDRTELDIINSIVVNERSNVITLNDFNNEEIMIANNLDVSSNINDYSCGIKNIINITSQVGLIQSAVEILERQSEEDLPNLYKTLIEKSIKGIAAPYRGSAGIFQMSTNISNNDYFDEETIAIFDELSDFHSGEGTRNPNSENIIKMWGLISENL